MELLIWAGGRWRRVCPSSGRVAGWRRSARFVCGRRGALRELPSLAALRSVVKGPRLPKKRVEVKSKAQKFTGTPFNRFAQNAQIQTIPTQKDACVQTDTESLQVEAYKSVQKHTSPKKHTSQDNKENEGSRTHRKRFRSASTEIIEGRPFKQQKIDNTEAKNKSKDPFDRNGKLEKKKLKCSSDSLSSEEQSKEFLVHENASKAKQKLHQTITDRKHHKNEIQKEVTHANDSEIASDDGQCKELVINEEDVLLLRRYIKTHNTNIDLLKYDEDDNYKTMIFFKINPLVRLQRCPRIAQMLKDRDANVTVHFARQLGLQTVTESEGSERIRRKKTKYRYAKAVAMTRSAVDSENDPFKKKFKERTSFSDESDKQKRIKKRDLKDRRAEQLDNRSKRNDRKEEKRTSSVESTTESDTFVESDSDRIETRNTRSTKKEFSSSDDAFVTRKVRKRAVKELSKRLLISDSDDSSDKSKGNQPGIGKNEQGKIFNKRHVNVQSLSSENETIKTQNETNNLRKKIQEKSEQNHNFTKYAANNDKSKDKNNDRENHKLQEKKKPTVLRRIVVPKRSSVPPGREYSTLEDQAIIAWLSASNQRERAVNGNRIWRELEDNYANLTGQKRSWHSLRNRYLRYILPGLPSLALRPSHAQRLRVHATLGELKSRKKQRRNSVFNLPVVRSASARNRPRPPPSPEPQPKPAAQTTEQLTSSSDSQEVSSPKKRLLRSSLIQSPSKLRTRHIDKLKSPSKFYRTSPRKCPTKPGGTKSPSESVRRTRSPPPSPSYSELTRTLLRNRSTPQPAATHHKRRLYNPQRPVSSGSSAT